jgi:putative transposase
MRQIITAKLKLITTAEQYQALRQTQLAYRDALNYVSRYAFEHNKTSNVKRLHKELYSELRARFGLLSQMACNVTRQVGATYKGLWTKLRKNIEHRKAGYTKKRFKGLDKPPKYVSPTVTYNYKRDYSFKPDQQVTIATLNGCIKISYHGFHRHIALIQHGATFGAAKLWYDKPHKQFYLLVTLELDIADPTPEVQQIVVGIDVGQRFLATTAPLTEEQQFFSGKAVRAKADHYARLRKRLQRKGTRSATRRLIAISGRERRFKLNINHIIAKSTVETHPHTLIGVEELTDIRERTKRRKRRRKGKKLVLPSPKERRANRHASQWSFAELHKNIAYKAALSGSMAIKVDADYTSQTCPMCGYTDKKNRPNKGLLFVCQSKECQFRLRTGRPYTLHADLVGARNIAMRTFLIRQDWVRTGQLSVAPGSLDDPDASDSETKAARLERYAELRWSPGASPIP